MRADEDTAAIGSSPHLTRVKAIRSRNASVVCTVVPASTLLGTRVTIINSKALRRKLYKGSHVPRIPELFRPASISALDLRVLKPPEESLRTTLAVGVWAASSLAQIATDKTTGECVKENPEGFGFLNLPGEIRNQIYRHALVNDKAVSHGPKRLAESSLTRVCRQIRTESLPIFYSENTFPFNFLWECCPDLFELHDWAKALGPKASWVRCIELLHAVSYNEGGPFDWVRRKVRTQFSFTGGRASFLFCDFPPTVGCSSCDMRSQLSSVLVPNRARQGESDLQAFARRIRRLLKPTTSWDNSRADLPGLGYMPKACWKCGRPRWYFGN